MRVCETTSRKSLAAFKWKLIRNEKDELPVQSSKSWSLHWPGTLLNLNSTFCSFSPYKATQNHIKALVLQLIWF